MKYFYYDIKDKSKVRRKFGLTLIRPKIDFYILNIFK